MVSSAARTAKAYRRLAGNGTSPNEALSRATPLEIVECFPGYNRVARDVVVRFDSTYPMESSAALLFPDDSILIVDDTGAFVARATNRAGDGTVHTYSDGLIPAEPLKRYRRYRYQLYPVRYPFTETERALVDEAIQLLDTVLINEYGLQLPIWAKWFPQDRLLVKNLIAAGGNAEAICSFLLGMLPSGRPFFSPEPIAEKDWDAPGRPTVTIRHQTIP